MDTALRSEKAFDKGNEIGQLNTGDLVEVTNRKDATYWYAYVPRLDKSGYLDKNYIQIAERTPQLQRFWTVKVKKAIWLFEVPQLTMTVTRSDA